MNGRKEKGAPSNNWVLVCFAMKEEEGAFEKIAKAMPEVSILVTGIGQKNAEKAARTFLGHRLPRGSELWFCRRVESGIGGWRGGL